MPPVFGPLIAVEGALVILRAGQRHDVLAVGQREEAGLLAVEEFLHHDFGARRAEAAVEHEVDGAMRFVAWFRR